MSSSDPSPQHKGPALQSGTYHYNIISGIGENESRAYGGQIYYSDSPKPGDCDADGQTLIYEVQQCIDVYLGV